MKQVGTLGTAVLDGTVAGRPHQVMPVQPVPEQRPLHLGTRLWIVWTTRLDVDTGSDPRPHSTRVRLPRPVRIRHSLHRRRHQHRVSSVTPLGTVPETLLPTLLGMFRVPTWPGPRWKPRGRPPGLTGTAAGCPPAVAGAQYRGGGGGPDPGRTTGTRSRWAGSPPGPPPSEAGPTGSAAARYSAGGRNWSVPKSPSTPARCPWPTAS